MPLPFDLEKAKAGWPLVTRDGEEAKFIAHVPEAQSWTQVLSIKHGSINGHYIDGRFTSTCDSSNDLFLADPPKKKVELWANIYSASPGYCAGLFTNKSHAEAAASTQMTKLWKPVAIAVPISFEVEETP